MTEDHKVPLMGNVEPLQEELDRCHELIELVRKEIHECRILIQQATESMRRHDRKDEPEVS